MASKPGGLCRGSALRPVAATGSSEPHVQRPKLVTKMQNLPTLLYWMDEREQIRIRKEAGMTKPWSNDSVFQTTYFCNVRREDDKVTRFIRRMYSPYVSHSLFEPNIILSRFLNWPDTLDALGYQDEWDPIYVKSVLNERKLLGKVWGNAYVVTTHGIPMDKIDYLCDRVMTSIEHDLDVYTTYPSCEIAAENLQNVEGISTFMAGQVVADLKNTPGHSLQNAPDWWTFALPGPGSRRGMDWLFGEKVPQNQWLKNLLELQAIAYNEGWHLCAQDLQNCLCEFDKYMRVKNATGRSKRSYAGQ